jgi:hypothetical protein
MMSEGLGQIPEACRKDDAFWSFDDVQERLVEAYGFLRRLPDREQGWLKTATMSLWQQVNATAGMTAVEQAEWRLYRAGDAPRLPGLTRDEVERMEATLRWLEWVQPEQRKVVHMAVGQLASGRQSRIAWGSLASDPTCPGSADKLRMAYNRSVTRICNRLNAAG